MQQSPGHAHARKKTLSHILTLRLLGSLLSKDRHNVAAGAIELEFWRHMPGTSEEKAAAMVGRLTTFLLLPTFPSINRDFIGTVIKCSRFDIAAEFHVMPPGDSGWGVMEHATTQSFRKSQFASLWVFGRLPDGGFVFLMQSRRQTSGLCFPSGLLEDSENWFVMRAALRAAKELHEEVGTHTPTAAEAAAAATVGAGGGGGVDVKAFGTTTSITPSDAYSSGGGGAGGGGGDHVDDHEHSAENAAEALCRWIIDNCREGKLDPSKKLGQWEYCEPRDSCSNLMAAALVHPLHPHPPRTTTHRAPPLACSGGLLHVRSNVMTSRITRSFLQSFSLGTTAANSAATKRVLCQTLYDVTLRALQRRRTDRSHRLHQRCSARSLCVGRKWVRF